MKKLTLALCIVFFSAILTMLPLHSMENDAQFAAQAEKYNADECLLFKLPNEMLFKIFLHRLSDDELSISSLQNDVKHLILLSAMCKRFNQLITLETIGDLYKKDLNKNKVLQEIIKQLDNSNKDKNSSLLAQVLLHAGADANIMYNGKSVLEIAIQHNEKKLIATLVQYDANPNIISTTAHYPVPIFFMAKTIDIAQILMDKGKVNIHATEPYGNNVLSYIIPACYSPDLMQFYLHHNADVTKLNIANRGILHEIAAAHFIYAPHVENLLEKGKFLLDVIPHMVNTLTIHGETPIDHAQTAFNLKVTVTYTDKSPKTLERKTLALEKIITLFRDHGGLTAQELAERELLYSHK